VKTYKDALSAGCVSLPRNPQLSADFVSGRNVVNQTFPVAVTLKSGSKAALAADNGFTIVKRTKAKKETFSNSSQSIKKKQPMIGVRNSSSLPAIVKRVKMKSPFFSCFAPEVSTTGVEKSLLDQLKLSSLTCTKLKTKFKTYASFHISVTEDDFPSINNTGVWPNAD
jgi:hypothetical protein